MRTGPNNLHSAHQRGSAQDIMYVCSSPALELIAMLVHVRAHTVARARTVHAVMAVLSAALYGTMVCLAGSWHAVTDTKCMNLQ